MPYGQWGGVVPNLTNVRVSRNEHTQVSELWVGVSILAFVEQVTMQQQKHGHLDLIHCKFLLVGTT